MNIKERDKLETMYLRYDYHCMICPKMADQRAHIIGNTKLNRKLYGNKIIDSIHNWRPACSLECNKKIDIGSNQLLQERIALIIESDMDYDDKESEIDIIINNHIGEKNGRH